MTKPRKQKEPCLLGSKSNVQETSGFKMFGNLQEPKGFPKQDFENIEICKVS